MKKFLVTMSIFLFLVARGVAQQSHKSTAAAIAAHPFDTTRATRIMHKLTDSLQLTATQQVLIHRYTRYIDSCKTAAVREYHGTASLWISMTRVEHRRDSLYQRVLTDKQFVRYGSEKSTLVLNN